MTVVSGRGWLLLGPGVALGSMAATVLFLFVAAALDRPRQDEVPFSDFLGMVDQGMVREIRVDGCVYTYTFQVNPHDRTHTRVTIGPQASADELAGLRPSKPDEPAPHVIVE